MFIGAERVGKVTQQTQRHEMYLARRKDKGPVDTQACACLVQVQVQVTSETTDNLTGGG